MIDAKDIFIILAGFFALAGQWMAFVAHLRLDKLKRLLNDERALRNVNPGAIVVKRPPLDF